MRRGRPGSDPAWAAELCKIARTWRTSNLTLRQLFEVANPDLSDEHGFVSAVLNHFNSDTALCDAWQAYVNDKR